MEVFASLHYYTNLPFVRLTAPYSTTIFRDTERGFKPRIKAHADGGNGGILPTENTSLFFHPQRDSASLGGRRLEAKMATERFDLIHSAPPCAPGRSMHSTNSTVAHPAASTVLYGLGKTNFAPVWPDWKRCVMVYLHQRRAEHSALHKLRLESHKNRPKIVVRTQLSRRKTRTHLRYGIVSLRFVLSLCISLTIHQHTRARAHIAPQPIPQIVYVCLCEWACANYTLENHGFFSLVAHRWHAFGWFVWQYGL